MGQNGAYPVRAEVAGEGTSQRMGNSMDSTRGIILIHSAPAALRPHLEWAVGAVFGMPVEFTWSAQPAEPRTLRAETLCSAPAFRTITSGWYYDLRRSTRCGVTRRR